MTAPTPADPLTVPSSMPSLAPRCRPRVWVEVDLARIVANFRRIAARVQPCQVMAILKANAYGLGVAPIARALQRAGAHGFGAAELREALELKPIGLPTQIIGAIIDDEIPTVVAEGIIAPITDIHTALALSHEAVRQNRTVECQYYVDTGMGKLGIQYPDAVDVIHQSWQLPGLHITGLYSHFPHAYGDLEFSRRQIVRLQTLVHELAQANIQFRWIHVANSDGINNVPESYQAPFNLVRTGINLYGVFDLEGQQALELEEVLTLKSRLTAIRELPAGATIGYGKTYTTVASTRVGTVAVGYADGVPLAMSNRGVFLIRGKPCSILGRVSMDYTAVDLAGVPEAVVGDEVVCLGQGISIVEWTQAKGSISYDIICSLGNRVERRYVGGF